MKINFKRSGGFGNIMVNVDLDTDTLPQDVGARAQDLLAKLLPLNAVAPEPAGADLFNYELTVTDNNQVQQLKTDDANLTDEQQELFDFLLDQ